MKAYKIWHDQPYYIHKNSEELKVQWTTDIDQAKDLPTFRQAVEFFFDTLGFSLNSSKYDALYLLKDENT